MVELGSLHGPLFKISGRKKTASIFPSRSADHAAFLLPSLSPLPRSLSLTYRSPRTSTLFPPSQFTKRKKWSQLLIHELSDTVVFVLLPLSNGGAKVRHRPCPSSLLLNIREAHAPSVVWFIRLSTLPLASRSSSATKLATSRTNPSPRSSTNPTFHLSSPTSINPSSTEPISPPFIDSYPSSTFPPPTGTGRTLRMPTRVQVSARICREREGTRAKAARVRVEEVDIWERVPLDQARQGGVESRVS
jgi:hypothetical protein